MTTITEADVEAAALDWLASVGWAVAHGPDIAPDAPLDIEIAPDLSTWNWKDEDELEDVVARGMMTARKADLIRVQGNRVIESLDAKAPPFDEPMAPRGGPNPSGKLPVSLKAGGA